MNFWELFKIFLGTDNIVLSRLRDTCSHVPINPKPKLEREKEGGTHTVKLESYFCHLGQLVFLFLE